MLPYRLDETQREAFLRHAEGKDVVCSMPTGSGKTAIGVLAIWRAIAQGRRVLYSTPLKALSAQKWREFAEVFGPGAVGLVTGDYRTLPDAPVVVTTAEALRNHCYPKAGGSRSASLDSVEAIVLDELHWINDPDRGATWEELVIYCPAHARLLGLSATVGGDPSVFCDWVATVRGEQGRGCELVTSSVRAVPLHFYVYCPRSGDTAAEPRLRLQRISKLVGSGRSSSSSSGDGSSRSGGAGSSSAELGELGLAPVDDEEEPEEDEAQSAIHSGSIQADHERQARGTAGDGNGNHFLRRGAPRRNAAHQGATQRRPTASRGGKFARPRPRAKGSGIGPLQMQRAVAVRQLLTRLQRLKWLPALSFVMSRRGCDQSTEDVVLAALMPGWRPLLSTSEREEVSARLEAFAVAHPEVRLEGTTLLAFQTGVAAHHAGQLPAQRALVEQLFENGLIKLVFATETLAAGINMPARCVVINSNGKTTKQGRRRMNGSELLQMAGRAGRRGIDVMGHTVLNLQPSSARSARWAASLLDAGPEPLRSHFAPSYEMLCTLLPGRRLTDLEALVGQSFGAFLAARQAQLKEEGDSEEERGEMADGDFVPDDDNDEGFDLMTSDVKLSLEASQQHGLLELREAQDLLGRSGVPIESVEEYADLCEEERLQLKLEGALRPPRGFEDDDFDDIFGSLKLPMGEAEPEPSALERHEVHQLPNRDALVDAIRKRRSVRTLCQRRALRLANAVQKSEAYRREAFGRYAAVLQEVGYLKEEGDGGIVRATLAGAAAAKATTGANAVWLGRVLFPEPLGHDAIARFALGPAEIASLVAAVVTDATSAKAKNDKDSTLTNMAPKPMQDVVAWACEERWRLAEIQWRHGVYEPVPLGLDAMALAHQWASGGSWKDVANEALLRDLADGDLFRILRRTFEVLQGFSVALDGPEFEGLEGLAVWRRWVRRASRAVDRSPLTDNVALEAGEATLEA